MLNVINLKEFDGRVGKRLIPQKTETQQRTDSTHIKSSLYISKCEDDNNNNT